MLVVRIAGPANEFGLEVDGKVERLFVCMLAHIVQRLCDGAAVFRNAETLAICNIPNDLGFNACGCGLVAVLWFFVDDVAVLAIRVVWVLPVGTGGG